MFKERVYIRAPRADILARRSLLEQVREHRNVLAGFQLPVARTRVREFGDQRRTPVAAEPEPVTLLRAKVEAAHRAFLAETATLSDVDGVLLDLNASFKRLIQILTPQPTESGSSETNSDNPSVAGSAPGSPAGARGGSRP